jgi:hypothetical protein
LTVNFIELLPVITMILSVASRASAFSMKRKIFVFRLP